MSDWYYADHQHQRQGPVDTAMLAQMQQLGQLQWTSLVWREGMADWKPLADFADEFAQVAPPPATRLDVSSGSVVASSAASHAAAPTAGSASPYAPPAAPLTAPQSVFPGGDVVDAGFWRRVAAYLIDGFILGIASYAVQIPLFLLAFGGFDFSQPRPGVGGATIGWMLFLAYVVPIAIQMVYYAWFHSSGKQATPGKMAIGIKVVNEQGARISFARGVGRYFAFLLSGFTIGVGYLMAAFTDRKRALHDLIASTLVVDQWAYTDRPDLQRRDLGTVTIVILALGGLLMLAVIGALVVAIGMAFRYGHA